MPEAIEAGYSQIAIILSSDVSLDAELSQISVEDTIDDAGSAIRTAYFHNLEAGFEWLITDN
ncbi:hypothetical protein LVD17_15030 [Fulvivirga ulvae]|uniref:hypothetical protein n=1 Tax=Fulvivirga ulvae TaxID=2904245 RepID=UPI001F364D23|nr:hypothetical protein [Fulvivirga ulvae]UII29612.1 hypothetical protein LVD17_15030 [Fulvivirga ulvae]